MIDNMGVSGKWIKALVGLKKSEKSQSSEKDESVSNFLFYKFPNFVCFFFSCLVKICISYASFLSEVGVY